MTTKDDDYRDSSFREKMLEHIFLAEILQEAWLVRGQTAEVLRPEVDNAGYDLVLELRGICRYIQLKGSRSGGRAGWKDVNIKLAEKPGGCVIWIFYENVQGRAKLCYRFFGKCPTERLDLGNEKGKGNTRRINIGRFEKATDVVKLFDKLFPGVNSGQSSILQTN